MSNLKTMTVKENGDVVAWFDTVPTVLDLMEAVNKIVGLTISDATVRIHPTERDGMNMFFAYFERS